MKAFRLGTVVLIPVLVFILIMALIGVYYFDCSEDTFELNLSNIVLAFLYSMGFYYILFLVSFISYYILKYVIRIEFLKNEQRRKSLKENGFQELIKYIIIFIIGLLFLKKDL